MYEFETYMEWIYEKLGLPGTVPFVLQVDHDPTAVIVFQALTSLKISQDVQRKLGS